MRINLPYEIIFAVGIILFSISLYIYGLIIKRLLTLIQKRIIWIFPVIAMIFLLYGAGMHFYTIFYYSDALSHADPADLFNLIICMLRNGSWEAFGILIAGIISLLGSGIYYRWTSR